MLDVTLDQLRTLAVVHVTGSAQRAARVLGREQSSVQKQLEASRPRPRSEGMAPDGAALETSARHPTWRFEPGRHTTLTSPRIVCVYTGRRHGPIRSSGRLSDGSSYGLRWRRGLCVPVDRIRDSQRYWVVPVNRLLSPARGVGKERVTKCQP
jgi:hypothetical protein